jgi:uncharacterized protein YbjT (DUF2867 family)
MRILLLGAAGFIGRELAAALQARGHEVVPVVRPGCLAPAFAAQAAIEADLNRDIDPATWSPRLRGIDAVVNCAGILQDSRRQSSEAIHVRAPTALYRACEVSGVRRVVLISAISADASAGTAYAATKLAGEEALRGTSLDWVVLRPSLVHARGAHGGTALFRALAALPCVIPVPGDGRQSFQPIHVDDLARIVAKAVESDALMRRTVEPVGPEDRSTRRRSRSSSTATPGTTPRSRATQAPPAWHGARRSHAIRPTRRTDGMRGCISCGRSCGSRWRCCGCSPASSAFSRSTAGHRCSHRSSALPWRPAACC